MFEISVAGKVALFIAVPTTVLLFYWLLGRNEEEDHDLVNDEVSTSRQTVIEIKVPRSTVGAIIGRQGASIKKLQEESGARINFKEESSLSRRSDDNRTIIIRGTSESAQKAELMIRKIIADMPAILTEEIQVPAIALGRIIGRGGENIRELSRISKAKIYIERTTEDYNKLGTRKVTITASREQIDIAKSLIQEKIEEEEAFRAKKSVMEANREQRTSHRKDRTPEHDTHHMSGITTSVVKDDSWESTRVVIPEQKDYMEVYISAVEHPGHFWIQIVSSEAMQLDQMTDEMNRFYATDEAKLSYAVSDVSVGDMVAAPFEHDNAWYRAKVIGIHEDKVDLYFVDFGDSEYVWTNQIRKLRPDFLSLKFQAVECKLANVKPAGENWSEAAIDFFEEITYCAQWKVLIAKTVRYESTDTCMMPCLQLYDTNGEEDVDINELMVSKKHGVMNDDWMAGEGASASSSDEKHKDMDSDSDIFFRSPEPEGGDDKANLPSAEKDWVNDYPWAWAYNDETPWQETVIKETEYQEKWLAQRDSFNNIDSPEGERIHVGADASNQPDYETMAISTELTSRKSKIDDNVLTVIEESGLNNTNVSVDSLHIDNNKNIEILDNHAHSNFQSEQFVSDMQTEDKYGKRDILKHDSCDSENLATTSDDTGFSMSTSEAEAYDHPSFSEMTTSQSSDMNISQSDTMSATDLMSDGASENLEETGFSDFPSIGFTGFNSPSKELNMSETFDKDSGLSQSLNLSEEKDRQSSTPTEKMGNSTDQFQPTAIKSLIDSSIHESTSRNNFSLTEGTSISGDNTGIVLDDELINQRDHDTFLNDEYERNLKQFQQNIIYQNLCESSIESFDGGGGDFDSKSRFKKSDSNISETTSDVSDESVVFGVGYCVIADKDLKQTMNVYPVNQNEVANMNLELETNQNDVGKQLLCTDSSVDATDVIDLAESSVDAVEIDSSSTGVDSSVDVIDSEINVDESPSNVTRSLIDVIHSPVHSAKSPIDNFETSNDAVNPPVYTLESSVDSMECSNAVFGSSVHNVQSSIDYLKSPLDLLDQSINSAEPSVDNLTQPAAFVEQSTECLESSSDISKPPVDFLEQSTDDSSIDLVSPPVDLKEQSMDVESLVDNVIQSAELFEKSSDSVESARDIFKPHADEIDPSINSVESSSDIFKTQLNLVDPSTDGVETSAVDLIDQCIDIAIPQLDPSNNSNESSNDSVKPQIDLIEQSIDSKDSSVDFAKQPNEGVGASVDLIEQSEDSVESSVDTIITPFDLIAPSIDSVKSFSDICKPPVDEIDPSVGSVKSTVDNAIPPVDLIVHSSSDTFKSSIDLIEQSIDSVESSVDNIIASVDLIEQSIDSVNTSIESSIDSVESSIDVIKPPIDLTEQSIGGVESAVDIMRPSINLTGSSQDTVISSLEPKEEGVLQDNLVEDIEVSKCYTNIATVQESSVDLHNSQNISIDTVEFKWDDHSQVALNRNEDVEKYGKDQGQSEHIFNYSVRNNVEEINVAPLSFHDTENSSDDKSVFAELNIPLIEYVCEVYEKSSVVQCDTVIRFVIVEPVEIVVDEQVLKEINQSKCEEDIAIIEIGENIRYPASTEMFQSFLQTKEEAVYILDCYETSSLCIGENYEVKPPLKAVKPVPSPSNNERLQFSGDECNSNILDDVCQQSAHAEERLIKSQRSSWHSEEGTGYETESTDAGESVITIIPSLKQSNPDQNTIGDLRDFDQDEEVTGSRAILEDDSSSNLSDQRIADHEFVADGPKPLKEGLLFYDFGEESQALVNIIESKEDHQEIDDPQTAGQEGLLFYNFGDEESKTEMSEDMKIGNDKDFVQEVCETEDLQNVASDLEGDRKPLTAGKDLLTEENKKLNDDKVSSEGLIDEKESELNQICEIREATENSVEEVQVRNEIQYKENVSVMDERFTEKQSDFSEDITDMKIGELNISEINEPEEMKTDVRENTETVSPLKEDSTITEKHMPAAEDITDHKNSDPGSTEPYNYDDQKSDLGQYGGVSIPSINESTPLTTEIGSPEDKSDLSQLEFTSSEFDKLDEVLAVSGENISLQNNEPNDAYIGQEQFDSTEDKIDTKMQVSEIELNFHSEEIIKCHETSTTIDEVSDGNQQDISVIEDAVIPQVSSPEQLSVEQNSQERKPDITESEINAIESEDTDQETDGPQAAGQEGLLFYNFGDEESKTEMSEDMKIVEVDGTLQFVPKDFVQEVCETEDLQNEATDLDEDRKSITAGEDLSTEENKLNDDKVSSEGLINDKESDFNQLCEIRKATENALGEVQVRDEIQYKENVSVKDESSTEKQCEFSGDLIDMKIGELNISEINEPEEMKTDVREKTEAVSTLKEDSNITQKHIPAAEDITDRKNSDLGSIESYNHDEQKLDHGQYGGVSIPSINESTPLTTEIGSPEDKSDLSQVEFTSSEFDKLDDVLAVSGENISLQNNEPNDAYIGQEQFDSTEDKIDTKMQVSEIEMNFQCEEIIKCQETSTTIDEVSDGNQQDISVTEDAVIPQVSSPEQLSVEQNSQERKPDITESEINAIESEDTDQETDGPQAAGQEGLLFYNFGDEESKTEMSEDMKIVDVDGTLQFVPKDFVQEVCETEDLQNVASDLDEDRKPITAGEDLSTEENKKLNDDKVSSEGLIDDKESDVNQLCGIREATENALEEVQVRDEIQYKENASDKDERSTEKQSDFSEDITDNKIDELVISKINEPESTLKENSTEKHLPSAEDITDHKNSDLGSTEPYNHDEQKSDLGQYGGVSINESTPLTTEIGSPEDKSDLSQVEFTSSESDKLDDVLAVSGENISLQNNEPNDAYIRQEQFDSTEDKIDTKMQVSEIEMNFHSEDIKCQETSSTIDEVSNGNQQEIYVTEDAVIPQDASPEQLFVEQKSQERKPDITESKINTIESEDTEQETDGPQAAGQEGLLFYNFGDEESKTEMSEDMKIVEVDGTLQFVPKDFVQEVCETEDLQNVASDLDEDRKSITAGEDLSTEENKKLNDDKVSSEGLIDDKESDVNQLCEIRKATENALGEVQVRDEIQYKENVSVKDESLTEKQCEFSGDLIDMKIGELNVSEINEPEEMKTDVRENTEAVSTLKEDSNITQKHIPAAEDITDRKNSDLGSIESCNHDEQKLDLGQYGGVSIPSINESTPLTTEIGSPEDKSDLSQVEFTSSESDKLDDVLAVSGENISLQNNEPNDAYIRQEQFDSTEDKIDTKMQVSEIEMNFHSEDIKCQETSSTIDEVSNGNQQEIYVTEDAVIPQDASPEQLFVEQKSQERKPDITESKINTIESEDTEQETDGPQAAGQEGLLFYNFGDEESKTEMSEDMKIVEVDGTLQFVPKDFVQEVCETEDLQNVASDLDEDRKSITAGEDLSTEENKKLNDDKVSSEGLIDDKESDVNQLCGIREATENALEEVQVRDEIQYKENASDKDERSTEKQTDFSEDITDNKIDELVISKINEPASTLKEDSTEKHLPSAEDITDHKNSDLGSTESYNHDEQKSDLGQYGGVSINESTPLTTEIVSPEDKNDLSQLEFTSSEFDKLDDVLAFSGENISLQNNEPNDAYIGQEQFDSTEDKIDTKMQVSEIELNFHSEEIIKCQETFTTIDEVSDGNQQEISVTEDTVIPQVASPELLSVQPDIIESEIKTIESEDTQQETDGPQAAGQEGLLFYNFGDEESKTEMSEDMKIVEVDGALQFVPKDVQEVCETEDLQNAVTDLDEDRKSITEGEDLLTEENKKSNHVKVLSEGLTDNQESDAQQFFPKEFVQDTGEDENLGNGSNELTNEQKVNLVELENQNILESEQKEISDQLPDISETREEIEEGDSSIHNESAVTLASELSLCIDSLKKEMELVTFDQNQESVALTQHVTSISNDVDELNIVLKSGNESVDIDSEFDSQARSEKSSSIKDSEIDWLKSPGISYRDVVQETLADKESKSECRFDGDTNLPEPQVSEQVFGLAYHDFYAGAQNEQTPFPSFIPVVEQFNSENTQIDRTEETKKIVCEDVCDSDYSIQPPEEIIDQSRIYVGEWLDGCQEAEPISYSQELVQDSNEVEKDDLNDTIVKEDEDSDDDYVIKLIYIPPEDECEKHKVRLEDRIIEDNDNIEAETKESAEKKFQILISQLEEIEKMPVASTSKHEKMPKSLSDLAEEVVQNDFFKIGAASLENGNNTPAVREFVEPVQSNKVEDKADDINREEKIEISKMDPVKQKLFDKFEELFVLEAEDSIDSETEEVTNNVNLHDGSSLDSYHGSVESLYVTAEEMTTSEDDHFSSGRDTEGESLDEEVDSEGEPITIQIDDQTMKIQDLVPDYSADETDTEIEDDVYDQYNSDNDEIQASVENNNDSFVMRPVEQEFEQMQEANDVAGCDVSFTMDEKYEQEEPSDSNTVQDDLSYMEVINMDDSLEHLKPLEELLKAHEINDIDDHLEHTVKSNLPQEDDQATPSTSENGQSASDSSSQEYLCSIKYVETYEKQQEKDDSQEKTLQLLSQYILPPDTNLNVDFEDAITKDEDDAKIEFKEDPDITCGLALATIMEEEEDMENKVISKYKEQPGKGVASSLELHLQERTKLETEIINLMSEILSVVSEKATRDDERAEAQKLAEDIEDMTQQMKYRRQMIRMIADEMEITDESSSTSQKHISVAESKVDMLTDNKLNLEDIETDNENLHSFAKVHVKEVKHFSPFFTKESFEGDESTSCHDDLERAEEQDKMVEVEGILAEEESNTTQISNVSDQAPIQYASLNVNEAHSQTLVGSKDHLMFTEAQTIQSDESTSEIINEDNVISHYEGLIEPDQSLLYKLETLYFIESKDNMRDEDHSTEVTVSSEVVKDLFSEEESKIEYHEAKTVEKSEVSLKIKDSDFSEEIQPEYEERHLSIASFDLPVTLSEEIKENPSFERQISELSFEIGVSSKSLEDNNSAVQAIEEQTQSKPKYTSSSQIIVDNFQVSNLTQSPPPMETSQKNLFLNMAVVEITSTDECSMSVTHSDMDDSVFGIESESECDRSRTEIGQVGESDHDPEQPTFDRVPWSSRKDLYGYKGPSRIYKSEFSKEIGSPTINDDTSILVDQMKNNEIGMASEQITIKESDDMFLWTKDDFLPETTNFNTQDDKPDECLSPYEAAPSKESNFEDCKLVNAPITQEDACLDKHEVQFGDLEDVGSTSIDHLTHGKIDNDLIASTIEERKDETTNKQSTLCKETHEDIPEKKDSSEVKQILQKTENMSVQWTESEDTILQEQIISLIDTHSTDEITQMSNTSDDTVSKTQAPESNLCNLILDDETFFEESNIVSDQYSKCQTVSKKENDLTFHDVCLQQEKLINIECLLETNKAETSMEVSDMTEEAKVENNTIFRENNKPIIDTLEEQDIDNSNETVTLEQKDIDYSDGSGLLEESLIQLPDTKSEQNNNIQNVSDTEAEVEFFSNQEPAKAQGRRGETPQEIMTRILQETEEMLNSATLGEISQDNSCNMNEEITYITNAVKMLDDNYSQIKCKIDSSLEVDQVATATEQCPLTASSEKDAVNNVPSSELAKSELEASLCHSSEEEPSIKTGKLPHTRTQSSIMDFSEYSTQSEMKDIRYGEDYHSSRQSNELMEESNATQFFGTSSHTISDEEDIDFEAAEAWAEYSTEENPSDYCNQSDIFGRKIYESRLINVSNVPDIVITASTPADESAHLLGAVCQETNDIRRECDLIPEDTVLSKQFSEFLDDDSDEDKDITHIDDQSNFGLFLDNDNKSDIDLDQLVGKLNLIEEQNFEVSIDEDNLPTSAKQFGLLTPPDSTQSESDSESASLDAEYEMVHDTDDDLKDEVHFDEDWMITETSDIEGPKRDSNVEEGKSTDMLSQIMVHESNQTNNSDGVTYQENSEKSSNIVTSDETRTSKTRLPSVYQRTMSAALSGVSEKPDWQVDMASIVLEGEFVPEDDENVFEENRIPAEDVTSEKTDDESGSKSDASIISLRNPFSSLNNDSTDTASECDSERVLPTDMAVSLDKKRQLQVGSSKPQEESTKKKRAKRGKKNSKTETSIPPPPPPQTTLSPEVKINKKSRSPSLEKKVETFKLGIELEQELNETLQILETKKRKKKKRKSKETSTVNTSGDACSTTETHELKQTQTSSADLADKSRKRRKGKGEKKKDDSEKPTCSELDAKSFYSICTSELSSPISPTESKILTDMITSDPSSPSSPTESEHSLVAGSKLKTRTKSTHIPRIEVKHDGSSPTVRQQSSQGQKSSNLLDVEQTHKKSRSKPRVHSKSRSPGRRRSNVIAVPKK